MIDIQLLVKEYSPEIALSVLFLRLKLGKATKVELNEFLSNNNVDVDRFIQLAEAHQIESIIYSIQEFREFYPSHESVVNFKARAEYRSRFNMVLLDELINLNRLLKSFEFPILFYKGVMLSKLLFNDFTTRATSDIDVLIEAKNFPAIREVLLKNDYEEVYFYPVDYARYYTRINREAVFRKKSYTGKYIFIELQWAPLPSMFRLPYNNEYYFSHSGSIQLMGEKIPILNLDQHLIILFLHHGISDLWRNLKHVFDIAELAYSYQEKINWGHVENYIKQWHFRTNAKVGFNLCELLFSVSVPVVISNESVSRETDATLNSLLKYPLLNKKKKSISNIRRQFLLTDSYREKILLIKGYLSSEFMPSMIDLQNHHFRPTFFPLYYITKRFRFLYKKNK